MKKHTNLLNAFILALSLTPLLASAGNGNDIDKKRTISKSYNVGPNDKLWIDNSFGNVVVSTWDQNVIKVDIEIGTKAGTDQKAQDMMDKISVTDNRDGNTIVFKTDIKNIDDHGYNKKHNRDEDHADRDGDDDNSRKFYIDYTVHMPAGNPLAIENSFGKTTVPDLKGEVSLTSKFGGLTTGKLDNVKSIDVEFGKADIGPVHNGDITFKFDGKSHIASISGDVKLKSEFSGNLQFTVDNNIEGLALTESYSSIRMLVSKDLSADFNIHTSFGSFHNQTDFNIRESGDEDDDAGPHFDKDYSGKTGDGKARIKIKSSFGSIRMSDVNDKTTHNDEDNDNDDDQGQEHHSKKDKVSI